MLAGGGPMKDGVGARNLRRGQDPRNIQIARARRRRADADPFVRQAHRQGIPVRVRVGDDAPQTQLAARGQHPDRDLAAVRDENLAEHPFRPGGP